MSPYPAPPPPLGARHAEMERPFLVVDGREQHEAVRALVYDLHELVQATEGGDEVDGHAVGKRPWCGAALRAIWRWFRASRFAQKANDIPREDSPLPTIEIMILPLAAGNDPAFGQMCENSSKLATHEGKLLSAGYSRDGHI